MSILAHDIDAIVAASASKCDYLRIGVIEAANNEIAVEVEFKEDIADRLKYALENLFEGTDENGRIALVLTERSPRTHGGAWAAAANRFCSEQISGVLVLETDRAMINMASAESFLNRIPDVLWEAKMPIFYDESGILSSYASSSHLLDHDERLVFKDVECMLEVDDLAAIGAWTRGVFPVYDVTGTDDELQYMKKISDYELDRTVRTCRASLSDVNCWHPSWSHEKWSDIDSIVLLLEFAAPGSTDLAALNFLEDIESPEEVPYAIRLDRSSSKELKQLDEFRKDIVAFSKLISATLKRYHVMFNPTYKDNFILSVEELRDLLEAFDISHKIQALRAGVPIEDIEV